MATINPLMTACGQLSNRSRLMQGISEAKLQSVPNYPPSDVRIGRASGGLCDLR